MDGSSKCVDIGLMDPNPDPQPYEHALRKLFTAMDANQAYVFRKQIYLRFFQVCPAGQERARLGRFLRIRALRNLWGGHRYALKQGHDSHDRS